MGIDPFALQSPHMAKLLDPAERKKLGVSTPSESQQRWQAREERKIHSDLTAWLQCKGIPFVHSRFDKPSGIRRGWPDYTCLFKGRVVCCEIKAPGGLLAQIQAEVIAELKLAGVAVAVCYSAKEAIDFIIQELLT